MKDKNAEDNSQILDNKDHLREPFWLFPALHPWTGQHMNCYIIKPTTPGKQKVLHLLLKYN